MSNEQTMKFYDAYQELEQIAKDMQDEPEKVIDVMEEKLKRAIGLNKVCNDRLGKVQAMLDQYKTEANVSTADNPPIHEEEYGITEQIPAEEIDPDGIPF